MLRNATEAHNKEFKKFNIVICKIEKENFQKGWYT